MLRVRALAFDIMTVSIGIDSDYAIGLVTTALADAPDDLLATGRAERFVHRAVGFGYYDKVAAIIDRMLRSSIDTVRQAGARQLTLASLSRPALDARVDGLLAEDPPLRAGLATVFAANASGTTRTDRIAQVLPALFDDVDEQVRTEAARVLDHPRDNGGAVYGTLLGAFAISRSAASHADHVLHMLDETGQPIPLTALDICERFVHAEGANLADLSTSAAGTAPTIIKILLRIYASTMEPDLRRRCLDLIDELVVIGAFGIDEDLTSLDR